jgi:hypothetical protein
MNPKAVPICPHLPTSFEGFRRRRARVTKPEPPSPITASMTPTPSRISWIVLKEGITRGTAELSMAV